MRKAMMRAVVVLATVGYASEATAGKFSFFTGGSKKISRTADDAPKVDEDAVEHGAIADGLDAVGDIGGAIYDHATGDEAPTETTQSTGGDLPDLDEDPARHIDFGGGITAMFQDGPFGRTTLTIKTPSGTIKSFGIRGTMTIAQEVARTLNLRTLPATGQVERDALLASGALRPATEADIDAWKATALRRSPHASTRIKRDRRKLYVQTRPLNGTELLIGGASRSIIFLAPGIPLDRAPMGASAYYTMDDGRCMGIGSGCRRFHEQTHETDTAACFPDLPRNVELHAFGTYEATPKRKSDFKVGRSDTDKTGQIDIYVAPTSDPVVLLLGSHRPVVWAIHRAEGAKIAAILARGHHSQAVAGVTDVPVRFSTRKDGLAPGCGGYAHDYNASAKRDEWFEEAKAIFGRAVHNIDGEYYGDVFAVGEWEGLDNVAPLPVSLDDIRASGKVEERGIDIPKGKLMLLGFFAFIFRKQLINAVT